MSHHYVRFSANNIASYEEISVICRLAPLTATISSCRRRHRRRRCRVAAATASEEAVLHHLSLVLSLQPPPQQQPPPSPPHQTPASLSTVNLLTAVKEDKEGCEAELLLIREGETDLCLSPLSCMSSPQQPSPSSL